MENLLKDFSNHKTETQVTLRNFGEEVEKKILQGMLFGDETFTRNPIALAKATCILNELSLPPS